MNQELPEVQLDLEKAENQKSNCQHSLDHEESKGIPENLCSIDYAKAFVFVDHNKLWKTLTEMVIPDYPICLLKNLYVGQEHGPTCQYGTTDWFKIEKGV